MTGLYTYTLMLWVHLGLFQKQYAKVLPSGTSSCDLVWIEDLCSYNWISETTLEEAE